MLKKSSVRIFEFFKVLSFAKKEKVSVQSKIRRGNVKFTDRLNFETVGENIVFVDQAINTLESWDMTQLKCNITDHAKQYLGFVFVNTFIINIALYTPVIWLCT